MKNFRTLGKKLALCLGFILISVAVYPQDNQQIDTFLNRYKEFLLLTDTSAASVKNIPPLNKDGKWNDINYGDNQPGAWQVADHLRRVRTLAIEWSLKKSTLYHSDSIKKTISLALDHWNTHRYKSKNWWHNEIGIPQIERDIIILMRDSLPAQQLEQSLEILAQYKLAGTGANLVWSADLGLHYGALTNNVALMKQCRDTILSAIKISSDEGVQPDYSFHQHGRRLQMYHYGAAFLLDNMRLAWQLRGLWLEFPSAKIQVLTDFVLKGWQWMARGINTVPGTIDRATSRSDALHSADVRKIIPLFYEVQPDSIKAFRNLLAVQQGQKELTGYRYFPWSDFTAYQQQQFSFFLKTNSTRTLLTESINEENLKGDLLNSGDAYFISNGKEYFNMMPFWDWNKLPGITNFTSNNKNKIRQQIFVGNVSDGINGLAVMDYSLKKDDQSLTAKKIWASYRNVVVALIADIKTNNLVQPAFTVLDQCRWQGNVTVNKPGNILPGGTNTFPNVKWVHQKNFVYIPLYNDSIQVVAKNVTGTWRDINHSEPDTLLKDRVFMPVIVHSADQRSSGYAVAYAATPQQAEEIAEKPAWKILRNDSICQVISFENSSLMAAVYRPGKIILSPAEIISVDRPCLLLIDNKKIFISDPAHEGGLFSGIINNLQFSVLLPNDGKTILIKPQFEK
ncbi:MAG: polysaccharide lyase family 8 super-sandwich domain-containing protein [Ginsengibacter sp.]